MHMQTHTHTHTHTSVRSDAKVVWGCHFLLTNAKEETCVWLRISINNTTLCCPQTNYQYTQRQVEASQRESDITTNSPADMVIEEPRLLLIMYAGTLPAILLCVGHSW